MHTGTVKSLDEAVRVMAKTQLDKDLNDGQVSDLVAFLETLNGEFPEQTMRRHKRAVCGVALLTP